jgi:hypothetical protein
VTIHATTEDRRIDVERDEAGHARDPGSVRHVRNY